MVFCLEEVSEFVFCEDFFRERLDEVDFGLGVHGWVSWCGGRGGFLRVSCGGVQSCGL